MASPETLSDGADARDGRCVTCADAASWMRVVDVDDARALARCVDDEGRRETVDTGVVGGIRTGDSLLVHAGAALQRRTSGDASGGTG